MGFFVLLEISCACTIGNVVSRVSMPSFVGNISVGLGPAEMDYMWDSFCIFFFLVVGIGDVVFGLHV